MVWVAVCFALLCFLEFLVGLVWFVFSTFITKLTPAVSLQRGKEVSEVVTLSVGCFPWFALRDLTIELIPTVSLQCGKEMGEMAGIGMDFVIGGGSGRAHPNCESTMRGGDGRDQRSGEYHNFVISAWKSQHITRFLPFSLRCVFPGFKSRFDD